MTAIRRLIAVSKDGQRKKIGIVDATTGQPLGFEIEHRDGRQDSPLLAPRVHVAHRVQELR